MPAFFLPRCSHESQEDVYARIAERCDREVPPIRRRIYSIVFEHDDIVWTATVGEHLRARVCEGQGHGDCRMEHR